MPTFSSLSVLSRTNLQILNWSYVIGYAANLGWKGPLPLLKPSYILSLPHEDPFQKLVENFEQLLCEPHTLRSIRISGKLIADQSVNKHNLGV